MGIFDKAKSMFGGVKSKAEQIARDHGDQITQGVDKATDMLDEKTKGAHADKLDKLDEGARKVVDKLDDTPQ